jgi:hypothetical protein
MGEWPCCLPDFCDQSTPAVWHTQPPSLLMPTATLFKCSGGSVLKLCHRLMESKHPRFSRICLVDFTAQKLEKNPYAWTKRS